MKELIFISNKNLELYYYKYETLKPELILELYRTKLFLQIQKFFIKRMILYFGKEMFNRKKNCSRTLLNIFSSWIFVQYANNNVKVELFPEGKLNYNCLINTLKDFVKDKEKDYKSKINNLVKYLDLDNYIKKKRDIFLTYKKCNYYKNNKNKFKITKTNVCIEKKNKKTKFIKYDIKLNFEIKEKKFKNILDNLLIPLSTYEKLNNMYKNNEIKKKDEIIICLIIRYTCLCSQNNQLAVPPKIMKKMRNDINLSFECFGSCFNNYFENYCSIFYDLEKYFGSTGSFFNILPISGTYEFNPPYETSIIEKGVNNILTHLKIAKKNKKLLTFILTLPIWDIYGKILMNIKLKELIKYDDFKIISKIKNSEFISCLRMIPKEKFSYKDYNNNCYKDVTIQNTYFIVLSTNKELDYYKIIKKYNFYYY